MTEAVREDTEKKTADAMAAYAYIVKVSSCPEKSSKIFFEKVGTFFPFLRQTVRRG